jgi:hypothetical protein
MFYDDPSYETNNDVLAHILPYMSVSRSHSGPLMDAFDHYYNARNHKNTDDNLLALLETSPLLKNIINKKRGLAFYSKKMLMLRSEY